MPGERLRCASISRRWTRFSSITTPTGELDGEGWSSPTLQERRAILHAAQLEIERLQDLVLALDGEDGD